MTDEQQPRKLRTWSEFGETRRRPTEYEIGAHASNYTNRKHRKAALEQNPSSPGNLWFLAYRDQSPVQIDDWEDFRDPDRLTYRAYVAQQSAREKAMAGLFDSYAGINHDQTLSEDWLRTLRLVFTPSRFPAHAVQMLQSYICHLGHSAYISNAAALAAADQLRRVTNVSYRTRELQIAYPEAGFATGERDVWENDAAWQPARETLELALIAYDWGESFTATNLVITPTLDDVLIRSLGEAARANGDDLTWLLCENLHEDVERRARWSTALARLTVEQRPENADAYRRWADKWAPRADAAAHALGGLLAQTPAGGMTAESVASEAVAARDSCLAEAGLGHAATAVG